MTRHSHHQPASDGGRRASVAVVMIIALVVLQLAVVAAVVSGGRDQDLTVRRIDTLRAFYAAEGAMSIAIREYARMIDDSGNGTRTRNKPPSTGANVGKTIIRNRREPRIVEVLGIRYCVRLEQGRAKNAIVPRFNMFSASDERRRHNTVHHIDSRSRHSAQDDRNVPMSDRQHENATRRSTEKGDDVCRTVPIHDEYAEMESHDGLQDNVPNGNGISSLIVHIQQSAVGKDP